MSCLYRALAYFHQQYSTEQMRATLCRYLSTNPELSLGSASQVIPWETGQSLSQYLQRMQHHSSWGGAIEIKAYADLFGMNVKVYSIPNRRSIEFLTDKNPDQAKWVALSWTGGHYEPIQSQHQHNIMERSINPPTTPTPRNQMGGNQHRHRNHGGRRPHRRRY